MKKNRRKLTRSIWMRTTHKWNRCLMITASMRDVCHFHFSDVDIAFEFYNRYARTRGFSARKNRTRKSRAGVLKLKNFVCHHEGF
ncbi:hypothetical protein Ahy_A06g028746 [Arachis hypogaea]|uniref:FAR1 domain-containing protein n=1 Tax=Arachis hypogaea TaxID=3818 RepID=A0A445CRI9_ARAHY|nr:hypothetical protein Ahy_A06g028746 [Arachis hypogaea]